MCVYSTGEIFLPYSDIENPRSTWTALCCFTRGSLVVPGVLVSYLAPNMGVYTCVSDGNDSGSPTILGQFIHIAGNPHLTFDFSDPG